MCYSFHDVTNSAWLSYAFSFHLVGNRVKLCHSVLDVLWSYTNPVKTERICRHISGSNVRYYVSWWRDLGFEQRHSRSGAIVMAEYLLYRMKLVVECCHLRKCVSSKMSCVLCRHVKTKGRSEWRTYCRTTNDAWRHVKLFFSKSALNCFIFFYLLVILCVTRVQDWFHDVGCTCQAKRSSKITNIGL